MVILVQLARYAGAAFQEQRTARMESSFEYSGGSDGNPYWSVDDCAPAFFHRRREPDYERAGDDQWHRFHTLLLYYLPDFRTHQRAPAGCRTSQYIHGPVPFAAAGSGFD